MLICFQACNKRVATVGIYVKSGKFNGARICTCIINRFQKEYLYYNKY
jgi:hypothetical protein